MVLVLAILISTLALWLLDPSPPAAALAPAMDQPAKVFRVSKFVAVPGESHANGRPVPYILPLLLPQRFELRAEIFASSQAVRKIRLAGLPLGHIPDSATSPGDVTAQDVAPASHSVIVRRAGKRLEAYVDGLPVLLDPPEKLPERLSIEPAPDETAILKNLVVTW